jgi:hypothetical protein
MASPFANLWVCCLFCLMHFCSCTWNIWWICQNILFINERNQKINQRVRLDIFIPRERKCFFPTLEGVFLFKRKAIGLSLSFRLKSLEIFEISWFCVLKGEKVGVFKKIFLKLATFHPRMEEIKGSFGVREVKLNLQSVRESTNNQNK